MKYIQVFYLFKPYIYPSENITFINKNLLRDLSSINDLVKMK